MQQKQLTIENIRNPKRKSGFDHVNNAAPGNKRKDGTSYIFWRAETGPGGDSNTWRGLTRKTAEEAAQDYCDYINSGKAPASKVKRPKVPKRSALYLKLPAHSKNRSKSTVKVADKVLHRKPKAPKKDKVGTVYLIGEKGNTDFAKLGFSDKPNFHRIGALQTGNPRELVGLAERPGTLKDEYSLHLQFEPDNELLEWFTVTPELLGEFDLTENEFESMVR